MNYRHTDFLALSTVSYVDKHNAATTKHCTLAITIFFIPTNGKLRCRHTLMVLIMELEGNWSR